MRAKLNFLIVHGAYGDPGENWILWLKRNLRQEGQEVLTPVFPTPEGQNWDGWHRIAEMALLDRDPANTVLIGHSIGATFVLRLAGMTSAPYKAVFAICPFMRDLGLPDFDAINATFLHHDFKWDKIRSGAHSIFCFAGADDPYVPLTLAHEAAEAVGTGLIVVEEGGHLNAKTGFTEFPLLLEKIRELE
ncbi:MAG: alpha/beta hydrolase [Alphaproteobacteria bacterium]|nr:alpha/beta hydrolase [Alphaproteobacteria bacterium]